jgi:toxin YhaV
MESHGWRLLFHVCLVEQLQRLDEAAKKANKQGSKGAKTNANVKLFAAVTKLMLETVPSDPTRDEYRLGNTMGPAHRHWRRAKIGRRFRLFFRFDTTSRIIVFAWINDEYSLRSAGSKTDPYVVFQKMLERGNPPEDWPSLIDASQSASL